MRGVGCWYFVLGKSVKNWLFKRSDRSCCTSKLFINYCSNFKWRVQMVFKFGRVTHIVVWFTHTQAQSLSALVTVSLTNDLTLTYLLNSN